MTRATLDLRGHQFEVRPGLQEVVLRIMDAAAAYLRRTSVVSIRVPVPCPRCSCRFSSLALLLRVHLNLRRRSVLASGWLRDV